MNSDLIEKEKGRDKRPFLQITSLLVDVIPYFWLKFLLFLYACVLINVRDYVAEMYRGKNEYGKWFWIPASCLVLVEVLNQVTFRLAKKNRPRAIHLKAFLFWVLFTLFHVSDTLIGLQAEKTGTWIFMEKWSALFVLFLLSAILPWYSFCPDIRFFILHGEFQWRNEKTPHKL